MTPPDVTLAGRYRLDQVLGGGGTAVVHRARDLHANLEVAVKELRPQFAGLAPARRRFLREAEIARRLEHPSVVRVLDAGEDGPRAFLVMELCAGETLRQLLDRLGGVGPGLARRISMRLADVLSHAHQRGVIHRDLKPENVFLLGRPASSAEELAADVGLLDRIKLGDFGQARVAALASLTGTSLTWGTPEYMAPEVFAPGPLDPRSDLYSLGVILHELITGRPPFDRTRALARLGPALKGAPVPLPPTGADPALDRVVEQLLAPRPEQRPASGDAVIERLRDPAGTAPDPPGRCFGCGATLPGELPVCLGCGQQVRRFGHAPRGKWKLVLRSLADDATLVGKLLDLLGTLVVPDDLAGQQVGGSLLTRRPAPLSFLTGSPHLYSIEEKQAAIALPAVLFDRLDEQTALGLEDLFRSQGLDALATGGQRGKATHSTALARRDLLQHGLAVLLATGVVGTMISVDLGSVLPLVAVAGTAGLASAVILWHQVRKLRHAPARFRLRGVEVAVPAADALLGEAISALGRVRLPEVRALFVDITASLYRLARDVEPRQGLQPVSAAARLVLDTAPEIARKVVALAARLETVDSALAERGEGELLQALGRLERRLAASDGQGPGEPIDHPGLRESRRRLEQALAGRQRLEEERDQLASRLCLLLGRLRAACRDAEALVHGPAAEEARSLETTVAELQRLLSPSPDG